MFGYYQVRGLSDEGMTDEEAWEKIWEAGTTIETSIGLPPIDIRRNVSKPDYFAASNRHPRAGLGTTRKKGLWPE